MIKIKHILLFLIVLGIIYLDYLFYLNRKKYNHIDDFIGVNLTLFIGFIVLGLPFLLVYTNFFEKISKILNTKINFKNLLK
jgi:hypothetical protein